MDSHLELQRRTNKRYSEERSQLMKRGSTLESPDCNLINVENKKRRIVLQSHRGTPLWHRDEEGKPDCLAELFFFQRLSIMSQEPRCRSVGLVSQSAKSQ